jgi:Vps52 / Sac2 family.
MWLRKKTLKFYFEEVFHSIVRILSDTCTVNFIFVIDFFSIRPDQYQPVFGEIFSKTYQLLIDSIASILINSFDILALLLILRINSAFQGIIEKRGLFIMNLFLKR